MKHYSKYWLAMLLLLPGCGAWKKPVDPSTFMVPTACPDFSGRFEYPGPEGAEAICEFDSHLDDDILTIPTLMFPAFDPSDLGGGYIAMVLPTEIVIRQEGCSTLHFGAGRSNLIPASRRNRELSFMDPRAFEKHWAEWELDLIPRIKGTEVRWTEKSLHFTTRFVASGFGAGWGIERLRFSMALKHDGALVSEFRHEQGPKAGRFRLSRCVLPRIE